MTPFQINVNGEMTDVTPDNGSHFTTSELNRLTESEKVELISLSHELIMVIDQQAKRKGKPMNNSATAAAFGVLANGAVVVCTPSQVLLEPARAVSA
jgi:hypothetical protein